MLVGEFANKQLCFNMHESIFSAVLSCYSREPAEPVRASFMVVCMSVSRGMQIA